MIHISLWLPSDGRKGVFSGQKNIKKTMTFEKGSKRLHSRKAVRYYEDHSSKFLWKRILDSNYEWLMDHGFDSYTKLLSEIPQPRDQAKDESTLSDNPLRMLNVHIRRIYRA